MNDDELKKIWRQQPLREPNASAEQLLSAMQSKTSQLRRCLDARDLRELIGCVLIIIIFGIFYFAVYRTQISRLGDLIVIGSTIFIAWKLIHARRTNPPAPVSATMVESLRAELNAVRTQSRLLGSVFWWYLLPGFIGLVVATWGVGSDGYIIKIICTLMFIAVDGFIYWLNQRARATQLLPVEAQLESLLHSAETGEPLDETHLAHLRPIVLSMAAAERVRPAEFKVDFWQIALWGEIGIIGIWFFLMVGLTKDEGRKAGALPAQTSAQIVHFEETNRYSVVARRVVDLFNAGDYAGVENLYNADMSKVFPPKDTSDFYTRLAMGFGRIENIEGPTGNGYQGWTAFRLHCQRGELVMSLALDADDKISGIYFHPPSESFGSFMRRFFGWRHLIWFPPFFLGGLLYSWLLQKMTERAVGISTLGVHLHRGLNLILWDEIREVRTFRILNFQNLWLVKESGEKTLVRWTSLERHSDLKAAVERCAPANHPIHKYLSLLKRI
jgi:hypothetical protein